MDNLRAKREKKHEDAKLAHKQKIEMIGQQVREEVKMLEQQKDQLHAEHWRQARERVEVANNLDAKLDASEAAQDQRERDDAADARKKWKEEMAKAKQEEGQYKQYLNEKVRPASLRTACSPPPCACAPACLLTCVLGTVLTQPYAKKCIVCGKSRTKSSLRQSKKGRKSTGGSSD